MDAIQNEQPYAPQSKIEWSRLTYYTESQYNTVCLKRSQMVLLRPTCDYSYKEFHLCYSQDESGLTREQSQMNILSPGLIRTNGPNFWQVRSQTG